MDMKECLWSQKSAEEPITVIVGGGVSGLYAAWKLGAAGKRVVLVEASPDRIGGRIETIELEGFTAEFGPMRFEPTLQPTFDNLIKSLDIEYIDFVGPTAEKMEFPKYDVLPEESDMDALTLLKRGIMLIMGQEPNDQDWIDKQTEDDYRRWRKHQKLKGRNLWQMGFWNALSADGVLSHQALMKVRDTGTFYHMIPENLNAIEWIIWWMRALKTVGQDLVSIKGGTAKITDTLLSKLQAMPNVDIFQGYELLSFNECHEQQQYIELFFNHRREKVKAYADRLILALPQLPLKKLGRSLPPHVEDLLDTVNGFAMLKIFFVTDTPWWNYDQKPQQYSNRMPTRELHYYRRDNAEESDGYGMVMLYTDRPATEFWRHYVVDQNNHDRAEMDKNNELVNEFAKFIARDVKHELTSDDSGKPLNLTPYAIELFSNATLDEAAEMIRRSIITYGIHDWACEPFGAANHGWKPNVQSWKVQQTLKSFSLGSGRNNVHICGEAYSDYHGFVEGALNSVHLVIDDLLEA
ncbi:flavin monoamine oxidase family protein [Shewanella violacea]|uniref:Tryptophan 2-monooxygenase n=1 Tax=Shewanella violacea (strain JCM 10179 / CIP 106290 / LMG 19151 / DSS12) TaxID=637905 RepID=D4ZFU6_SHEVD|nr:FAD-dependent oxidoreductase [Shewanella violacea]BAJ00545.1 amine oxidase, flavin-containing superfamily [Shewanella violacea DSS12]